MHTGLQNVQHASRCQSTLIKSCETVRHLWGKPHVSFALSCHSESQKEKDREASRAHFAMGATALHLQSGLRNWVCVCLHVSMFTCCPQLATTSCNEVREVARRTSLLVSSSNSLTSAVTVNLIHFHYQNHNKEIKSEIKSKVLVCPCLCSRVIRIQCFHPTLKIIPWHYEINGGCLSVKGWKQ